jgi:hypothetical protein
MIYSKYIHVTETAIEHYGDDGIYRELIHQMLENVSVQELKQVFTMYKRPNNPYSGEHSVAVQDSYIYEIHLDLPLTERMIDLKDEINRQKYGDKIIPSYPKDYEL